MKKAFFISIFIFLLLSSQSFANEFWVYVGTEDLSGVTESDDAGRYKRGDVIAVLPVTEQYTPTQKEKERFLILRVGNLTLEDKWALLSPWKSGFERYYPNGLERTSKIAYRANKLDINSLELPSERGVQYAQIPRTKLFAAVSRKDNYDLVRYRMKRYMYLAFRRPAIKLASVVVPRAHADVVSHVNTTGEDYNTLSLWEAARDGDLVTETRQETVFVSKDEGALDDNLSIAGSTTNSTYFMRVTVKPTDRHDGTEGTGVQLLPTGGASVINMEDTYATVEWLDIDGRNLSDDAVVLGTAHNMRLRHCIIHDINDADKDGIRTSNWTYDIVNNIIYNATASSSRGMTIGGNSNIYGNTIFNTYQGIFRGAGSITARNNAVFSNNGNSDFTGTWTGETGENNMCGDTTCEDSDFSTGNNNLPSQTVGDQFVNITGGSEDLHLKAGATAINAGNDVGDCSGDLTNCELDIDGRDRHVKNDLWDIGADEYVSISGTAINTQGMTIEGVTVE